MSENPPVLTISDVARLLDPPVGWRTISTYLFESRPGRRYGGHSFPAPDGRIGRAPWWKPERTEEIRAWVAARPGQGAGGGPKPRG
jgi:hypothetical protein